MLCQVGGTFDRAASAEARRTAAPAPLTCPLSHENHTPSGRLHHPGPAGHGFETASGANWVHEIKHDGYRMIVRRDGPKVRLYSRNAYDWTARLPAIAGAAERIEANSFTIDGEAVVVGPDGLSRFEELPRREAAHKAILYAFDLIEHDGEDPRDRPFLDRKAALARLLRNIEAGIVLNEHVAGDGPMVFEHACRLGAEGIVSKRADGTPIDPVGVRAGSRSAIPRASRCSGSAARIGIDNLSCSMIRATFPVEMICLRWLHDNRCRTTQQWLRHGARREPSIDSVTGSRNGYGASHRETSPIARSPGNCAAWPRRKCLAHRRVQA
jgi:hypothetical protein